MILSKKRITKALIRLLGCAGWSAPVLFAVPRRQVISRRDPIFFVLQLPHHRAPTSHRQRLRATIMEIILFIRLNQVVVLISPQPWTVHQLMTQHRLQSKKNRNQNQRKTRQTESKTSETRSKSRETGSETRKKESKPIVSVTCQAIN